MSSLLQMIKLKFREVWKLAQLVTEPRLNHRSDSKVNIFNFASVVSEFQTHEGNMYESIFFFHCLLKI